MTARNTMEPLILDPISFYPRFSHITGDIFNQMDKKSISQGKEVSKSWQGIIDNKKIPWIKIINIPALLLNGETYLR